MEALDIDDVIAHLLVAEGFVQVDDITLTLVSLVRIEGFDEEIAEELQARAEAFVSAETSRLETRLAGGSVRRHWGYRRFHRRCWSNWAKPA